MNYYERHLGDYAKDTGHLSMLEHGAYTLLLDRYYSSEAPIPVDQAYRVCRAKSREERAAVDAVLAEFFVLENGAWGNGRTNREIKRYREKSEKARASINARWAKVKGSSPVPPKKNDGNTDVLDPNAGRTTHQAPSTKHQTPEGVGDEPPPTPTRAGIACRRMRTAGLQDANPAHPLLLALLQAGITDDELAAAAEAAVAKGKPFAYALAVAQGRRKDAAGIESLPDAPPPPEEAARQQAAADAQRTAAYLAEQQAQRDAAKSPEAQRARREALAKLGGIVTVITPNAQRTA